VKVRVIFGRTKLVGVGASITGCKLGRRLGFGASSCTSRASPFRRCASSAESRVDRGKTPPIVGCGESFDGRLGALNAGVVFFSLVFLPLPLSAGSPADSMLLCFGVQTRPALQRIHINQPPTISIKRAVAVNTPVTSASKHCKTNLRRGHPISRAHLYSKRRTCIEVAISIHGRTE